MATAVRQVEPRNDHDAPVSRPPNVSAELAGSLARGELTTHYQPIVSTVEGRIIGVEALLRWEHPDRGLVSPGAFVPLAEESGLIVEIGRWVLHRACVDRRRWPSRADLGIFVNVSPSQLTDTDFAATVEAVLADTGTDPSLVTLEMTESGPVKDVNQTQAALKDLKALGVTLALDDFGVGYSSLGHLKRFPFDAIKIDREFIADLGRDPTAHRIVTAIARLAVGLNLAVIAEGVETADQHREVAMLGCASAQGFYFARPMPAHGIHALLAEGGVEATLPRAS